MKRIRRFSPEDKKRFRESVTVKYKRLPEHIAEQYRTDVTSFDPPGKEGAGDFEEYARTACEAVGVPFVPDPKKVFHHVGYFTGMASVDSLNAFVQTYIAIRTPHKYVYFYEEYLDAIKRVGKIQAQLDAIDKHEKSEEERFHNYQEKYDNWAAGDREKPSPSFFTRSGPSLPPDYDLSFFYAYNLRAFTPNRRGYINYINAVAPDLHELLEKSIPLYLEDDPEKPHGYVLGTSGSGKSELLKLLIHTYVQPNYSGSVVVVDPTGDFTKQIAHWKEFNTQDRLVYIEPTLVEGLSPVINPFEIYGIDANDYSEKALNAKRVTAQRLAEAIGQIVGDLSPLMSSLLRNCVLVLLDKKGSTLEDLHDFVISDRNSELIAFGQTLTHHDRLPEYFSGKDSGFNQGANKVTKSAIERRIGDLLQTGHVKRLTCGKSTLQLEELAEQHKVLLFNLAQGAIGNEESKAFGRLIIAMLLGMAYRRSEMPEKDRIPVSLLIDECENFVTKSMVNILNETRKYKLSMTLAQQIAGQHMPIDVRETVLQGTNMLMVGRSMRSGAKRNADMVSEEAIEMEQLKTGEFYTLPKGYAPALKFKTRTDLLKFSNSVSTPIWRLTLHDQIQEYYQQQVSRTETVIDDDEDPDITPQP